MIFPSESQMYLRNKSRSIGSSCPSWTSTFRRRRNYVFKHLKHSCWELRGFRSSPHERSHEDSFMMCLSVCRASNTGSKKKKKNPTKEIQARHRIGVRILLLWELMGVTRATLGNAGWSRRHAACALTAKKFYISPKIIFCFHIFVKYHVSTANHAAVGPPRRLDSPQK